LDDSRLLDTHLANCERCVEHERRVVQAQDGLVASFVSAQPAVSPPSLVVPEPPALKVIEEPVAAPPAAVSPEPPPSRREPLSLTGLAWGALAVLAVLLTVAAIAIAIAGFAGAL
jgi:hypothetical protein